MKYNIEKLDSHVVIWDDEEGIGLRFQEGDSMQRYTSEVIIKDPGILSTEDGLIKVNDVSDELRKYAETIYPEEFAPIKEGMNRVEDYPIFKENTDEVIRYLNKEDVSETLLDEIAHDNVVRIQQNRDGSLSYQIKETQHSYFSVQPEMEIKKGFLGYFTPKAEDVAHFNNNELLAAQYAVNVATTYDDIEKVYIAPFKTRWKSTTKELAERTVTLIIDGEEHTYHFKRIWL